MGKTRNKLRRRLSEKPANAESKVMTATAQCHHENERTDNGDYKRFDAADAV